MKFQTLALLIPTLLFPVLVSATCTQIRGMYVSTPTTQTFKGAQLYVDGQTTCFGDASRAASSSSFTGTIPCSVAGYTYEITANEAVTDGSVKITPPGGADQTWTFRFGAFLPGDDPKMCAYEAYNGDCPTGTGVQSRGLARPTSAVSV